MNDTDDVVGLPSGFSPILIFGENLGSIFMERARHRDRGLWLNMVVPQARTLMIEQVGGVPWHSIAEPLYNVLELEVRLKMSILEESHA